MIDAATLLKEASETLADRSAERDVKKERAMGKTVAMFNAAFGTNLTIYQGWMFMIFLKIARANGGRFRKDDYLDMSAYSALAGEARSEDEATSVASFTVVKLSDDEVDLVLASNTPAQG